MTNLKITYEGDDLNADDIATSLGALGALVTITAQYLDTNAEPAHATYETTDQGYDFAFNLPPALTHDVGELLFGGPKTFGLNGGGLFAYLLFLYGREPERIEEGHASTLIEVAGFPFLADKPLLGLSQNLAARTMVDRFTRILENGAQRISVTRMDADDPALRVTPAERVALKSSGAR